ncbi:MAG TPA: class I SAM-dependent methyltransferase [Kamptonema sp.]|nr:class I SAM-dependent methyltransferase [Kamptonema sp.]
MLSFPRASFLEGYWQDSFNLKQHLQDFCNLDSQIVESQLEGSQENLAELGRQYFNWEKATEFYRDRVGEAYLFELGTWHLTSQDYIGTTLQLTADLAQGRVLDFGGGIGTHTIAAALSPKVEQVVYCDINPINCALVKYRLAAMGLTEKVQFCSEITSEEEFDLIMSFDVMEHLPDPSYQLLEFHKMLSDKGKLILNWYFFKGFNQEFPFHLDHPQAISQFYQTLQRNFLEIFHPYLITTRCYEKCNLK